MDSLRHRPSLVPKCRNSYRGAGIRLTEQWNLRLVGKDVEVGATSGALIAPPGKYRPSKKSHRIVRFTPPQKKPDGSLCCVHPRRNSFDIQYRPKLLEMVLRSETPGGCHCDPQICLPAARLQWTRDRVEKHLPPMRGDL